MKPKRKKEGFIWSAVREKEIRDMLDLLGG